MSEDKTAYPAKAFQDIRAGLIEALDLMRRRGPSQIQFWFIALLIGVASGFAALSFRKGIDYLQGRFYGTHDLRHLHSFASELPWFWVLLLPVLVGFWSASC